MAAALALLISGRAAQADEPRRATLTYGVAPGIDGCFEASELKDAVAARLGYVPFADQATLAIRAQVRRAGSGLSAELKVNDGSGESTRQLGSATRDCGELSRALALAISVAIDPMSLMRAPSPPPAEPEPAAPPPPPAAASSPPEPAPASATQATPAAPPPTPPSQPVRGAELDSRVRLRVLVTGHAALLTLPGVSGGASLGLGVRRRALWLDGEFRYDFPGSAEPESGPGQVKARLFGGTLGVCHGNLKLGLCALGLLARVNAEGSEVAEPKQASSLLLGVGARASLELPLSEALFFRAHFDALYCATPWRLELRGQSVWESSPVALAPGLGLGGQL